MDMPTRDPLMTYLLSLEMHPLTLVNAKFLKQMYYLTLNGAQPQNFQARISNKDKKLVETKD